MFVDRPWFIDDDEMIGRVMLARCHDFDDS
jgi:hypothetical protein